MDAWKETPKEDPEHTGGIIWECLRVPRGELDDAAGERNVCIDKKPSGVLLPLTGHASVGRKT